MITPLMSSSKKGQQVLRDLNDRFQLADPKCQEIVSDIIAQVRSRGDEAVLEYTRKFDAPSMTADSLRASEAEMAAAFEQVDESILASIRLAK